MNRFFILFLLLSVAVPLSGQMKQHFPAQMRQSTIEPTNIDAIDQLQLGVPLATPAFFEKRTFKTLDTAPIPEKTHPFLKAHLSETTGTPYLIEGELVVSSKRSLNSQVEAYFEEAKDLLNLSSPVEELQITKSETDEVGISHIRLQQTWQGVPVYGAEAILHKKADAFYMFNGRLFPTPKLSDVYPRITSAEAINIAVSKVSSVTRVTELSEEDKVLIGGEPYSSELVIYHPEQKPNSERLAWRIVAVPNLSARFSFFIDAKTGDILHSQNELCQLIPNIKSTITRHKPDSNRDQATLSGQQADNHPGRQTLADGPATANAQDLFGIQRLINTYEKSGSFYLIDASRSMFKTAQSTLPDDPTGVIWTIDARNKSPENSDFQVAHITSFNNSWNNPKAVSAHYHGAKAFEYFSNTFIRNSINGRGGNIISLINVVESDGSQMDNAFWNGAAMFYGNGNQAFSAPLCKALDVAGHEMAHGVIQSTSNLEYYGESGALNESFADVFGAMIDRDDWMMGEDIVNKSVFPTGALRDMSNPHNGGSSLDDPGYQPAHYSERYTGSEDNAGVHINSGIPNKAFQLFADNPNVGKSKAETVYYRALTVYLFKSSRFIDLRIAVIQSANDLYNATVANAAAAAFDAVGIAGSGTATQSQTDIKSNPGSDFILMSDKDFSALYIFNAQGQAIANPLVNISPASRPSVTDDGSVVVFIAKDKTMRAVTIDWSNGQSKLLTIHSDPIWRNAAISRDGRRIAALTATLKNELNIYDFDSQKWFIFKLFNPTTGQGGPVTDDVVYADVLEWDFSGEWIMYDALNTIKTTGTQGIEYWDISFAKVWNLSTNKAGDGRTSKLFNGLPDDVSVGNPTFSKNSDYIIAFDYFDEFADDYFLMAANLETGKVGTIFENLDLSWPNFSIDDKRMVFNAEDNAGNPVLAFISLGTNKISASGNASIFIDQGRWGVWFANGDRVLVNTGETLMSNNITVYPNPVRDVLNISLASVAYSEVKINVIDLTGRQLLQRKYPLTNGVNTFKFPVSSLASGIYLLRIDTGNGSSTHKFVVE